MKYYRLLIKAGTIVQPDGRVERERDTGFVLSRCQMPFGQNPGPLGIHVNESGASTKKVLDITS